MSFLDNLENNLKALEGREEGGLDESKRREDERARVLAAAPWAERLKTGDYAKQLMGLSARAGHARRMKINLAWIGPVNSALRLEARGERLELRPGAGGVEAIFAHADGAEIRREPVDLNGSPADLLERWLKTLDGLKAIEE